MKKSLCLVAHAIVCVLFFGACSRKPQPKVLLPSPMDPTTQVGNNPNFVQLSDTPVPVSYKLVAQHDDNNATLTIFQGIVPMKQTKQFYLKEMERLGWDIADMSHANEALLFCRKMTKHCAISIRTDNDHTYVHLFTKADDPKQLTDFPANPTKIMFDADSSLMTQNEEIY